MSETAGAPQQEKSSKAQRKPERESLLTPMLAATRHSAKGKADADGGPGSAIVRRQCACGRHTIGGGECAECQKKREAELKRTQAAGEAEEGWTPEMGPIAGEDLSRIPSYMAGVSKRPVLQPNLMVGAPGDPYEQEAEQVAQAVMTMPEPGPLAALDEALDLPEDVSRRPAISRIQASGGGAFAVSPAVEAQIGRMEGGGAMLPEGERRFFEGRMGYDFSGVRVHADANAAQVSRAIQARAFTMGRNIAFSEGAYRPGTDAGRRLLAHELTHVVQQGAAGGLQRRLSRWPGGEAGRSRVLGHLQSLSRQPGFDASVYRKEIAEFHKRNSQMDIAVHQQRILETQPGVDVRERNSSATLRRCGGCTGGSCGTSSGGGSAATPVLRKSTVSGPTARDCGGFSWGAKWSIENATTSTNGWIVQKVALPHVVTDCSGVAVDIAARGALNPAWYPLWEAWQVRGGQVFVGGSTSPHSADTYGSPPVGDATQGSLTVLGTAEYYDGLTLPSSFTVRNAPPAHALPVTNSEPTLTGGTGSLAHNLTATWDCCTATKTTTLTTT